MKQIFRCIQSAKKGDRIVFYVDNAGLISQYETPYITSAKVIDKAFWYGTFDIPRGYYPIVRLYPYINPISIISAKVLKIIKAK